MTLAITVREAKAALVEIKKLTPACPRLDDDGKLSLKEAVFLMAPELAAMTKRGFTLKELAAGLQAQKIPVKPATLNRYLNEYKAGQTETEAGSNTPKGNMKNPPTGSEGGMPQEPAEAVKTREAETKETSTEGGQPTETVEEKSENTPPDFRESFLKSQEQKSGEATEGSSRWY